MDVLLSIKPKFARAIFSGEKIFEFRRAIFRKKDIGMVYLYASRPTGLVVGEFEIEGIIAKDPDSVWDITKNASGISKEYFDKYFEGRDVAHAIKVGKTREYSKPLTLRELFNIDRPPQSFMYVAKDPAALKRSQKVSISGVALSG